MTSGKDEEIGGMSPTFYREMRDISADLKQLQLQLSTFNTDMAKITYGQEFIQKALTEMKSTQTQDSIKVANLESRLAIMETRQNEQIRIGEQTERNKQWIIGLFIGLIFSIITVVFLILEKKP